MSTRTPDHYQSPDAAREEARAALLPSAVRTDSRAWDQFVLVMRRILPAIAIVLGSLTAFWPFVSDQEVSFTLSQDEMASSDGKVRMTNLRYQGTDAIDRLFTLTAATGEQDDPSTPRVKLTDIRAEMNLDRGGESLDEAYVIARTGIYRRRENTLSLVGGVHVDSGNGYELDMAGAEVNLRDKTATGQGMIKGLTPLGTVEAGRMELIVSEQAGIFDGGVKFNITPNRPTK